VPLARLSRGHVCAQQIEVAIVVEIAEGRAPTHAARIAHAALGCDIPKSSLAVILEQTIVQARRQILDGHEHIEIPVVVVVAESRTGRVDGRICHTALRRFVHET